MLSSRKSRPTSEARRLPTREEKERSVKRLTLLLERLEGKALFVEGKKDQEALAALGFPDSYALAGKLRQAVKKAAESGVSSVVILTDLDAAGNELAGYARDELRGYGIKCDTELRKEIAGLLGFRNFEDMKRKHDEFEQRMR